MTIKLTRHSIVFLFLALFLTTVAFTSRAQVDQKSTDSNPEAASTPVEVSELADADLNDDTVSADAIPAADDEPADLLDGTDERAGLGVTFAIDRYGVFCKFVYPGSPAAKAGLRPGIRILNVNETECRTIEDTVTAIRALKPGDEISMRIVHDGEFKSCTATLSTWKLAFGATLQKDKDLTGQVAQLAGMLATLSKEVDGFAATTERLAKAEDKVGSLEKGATSSQKNLKSLQKTAESSQKSIESLQKSTVSAQKNIETIQKNAESSQKNLKTLQKSVESLSALSKLVKTAQDKIASLEKNIDTLNKERTSLTATIDTLNADIAKLKSTPSPTDPSKTPDGSNAKPDPKSNDPTPAKSDQKTEDQNSEK